MVMLFSHLCHERSYKLCASNSVNLICSDPDPYSCSAAYDPKRSLSCCNPIPGDDVIAFNFPGEPLQIHRSNCAKAIQLSARYGNNIVKAKWQPKSEIAFLAELKITALDTAGLLNRMTNTLSNEMKLNLHSLHMEAKQDLVEASLSIFVHNTNELDDLINKLNRIKEVQKVVRKNK